MQLGYTTPLRHHLGLRGTGYGAPCDLRLCWELHVLQPGGRASLFCVHASSRFAMLLYSLTLEQWRAVPEQFAAALERVLCEEVPRADAERYLALAGGMEITRTHGRRPVAFLNRAVDDLYALPVGLEADTLEQPQVRLFLNDRPCRAAGHEGTGTAREFLRRDLRALGGS